MQKFRLAIFAVPLLWASSAMAWDFQSDATRCWVSNTPSASRSAPPDRGDTGISVLHNKAEGSRYGISILSGLPDVSSADVTVEVDGKEFEVLPWGGAAFPKSGQPELDMVQAMKAGNTLTVTWKLQGMTIEDVYSLLGFTAGVAVMDRMCPPA